MGFWIVFQMKELGHVESIVDLWRMENVTGDGRNSREREEAGTEGRILMIRGSSGEDRL